MPPARAGGFFVYAARDRKEKDMSRACSTSARRAPRLLTLAIALVAMSGCARHVMTAHGASPSGAFPFSLTDDDGQDVSLQAAPQRIVTWGPSNTEILFALGLGSRVVGVSGSFDDYPPQARSVAKVGDASGVQPNIEKVVSLHPDIVLNAFLGGDQWKARLRGLGIPVFSIYATGFDDALHDIESVGRLTGTTAQAEALTQQMARAAGELSTMVSQEPPVTCFLEEGYPGIYTIGPHTFVFDILRRAGCDPVTASAGSDYPAWSLERLVRSQPAVYLVASESGASAADIAERPGFAGLAAVRSGRVYQVDSDLISRPGPRLVDGLRALAEVLHPSLPQ
jgi:iron complex transport system substrate-binding protein